MSVHQVAYLPVWISAIICLLRLVRPDPWPLRMRVRLCLGAAFFALAVWAALAASPLILLPVAIAVGIGGALRFVPTSHSQSDLPAVTIGVVPSFCLPVIAAAYALLVPFFDAAPALILGLAVAFSVAAVGWIRLEQIARRTEARPYDNAAAHLTAGARNSTPQSTPKEPAT